MLDKLERKIGKFAIPHLINYLIGGYVIGYLLYYGERISNLSFLNLMTLEPYQILHGAPIPQFWRVITWVLIPPIQSPLWAVIMMYFYWQLGTTLERVMGTFRFNVYIFGGIISTVIGAFILYGGYALSGVRYIGIGSAFSTWYINLGIFLAFALCFPEERVLLFFFIPIKMKWMALLYVIMLVPDLISSNWAGRVVIICSLFNFFVFFLSTRDFRRISPKEMYRKQRFQRDYRAGGGRNFDFGSPSGRQVRNNPFSGARKVARHKCSICGRTEITNPELEFRFCSKCRGNHEYCNDHLFTHAHIM